MVDCSSVVSLLELGLGPWFIVHSAASILPVSAGPLVLGYSRPRTTEDLQVCRPSLDPRIKRQKFNFINSGPVDIIRTVYYIHGPELMKLNFCRLIRVMNDGPYTLL